MHSLGEVMFRHHFMSGAGVVVVGRGVNPSEASVPVYPNSIPQAFPIHPLPEVDDQLIFSAY